MITVWNSCITVLPRGKQFFLFTCKWRPLPDPRYYSVFQSVKRVYSYTLLTTNIPSLVSLRGRKKWNCTQWKRRRRKKRKLRREGWLLDCIHPSRGLSASSNSFKSHEWRIVSLVKTRVVERRDYPSRPANYVDSEQWIWKRKRRGQRQRLYRRLGPTMNPIVLG